MTKKSSHTLAITVIFILGTISIYFLLQIMAFITVNRTYEKLIEKMKRPICQEWQRFDLSEPVPENTWMFESIIGVGWSEDGTIRSLTITKCLDNITLEQ